jgi:hypothetical protein
LKSLIEEINKEEKIWKSRYSSMKQPSTDARKMEAYFVGELGFKTTTGKMKY